MNIAQLLHNQPSQQTIPHWPVYSIRNGSHQWHFYSRHGVSLKKKIQNTNITDFFCLNQQSCPQSESDVILQTREVDYRQPRDGALYNIKVRILTVSQIRDGQQEMQNNWETTLYSQTKLFKIKVPTHNKLYTMQWSPNIVTSSAPMTAYLREKLSEYGQLVCKKAQERWLQNTRTIKQFQIIFTFDENQGKLRIVLAHNFVLTEFIKNSSQSKYEGSTMFSTDLSLGTDHYQCLQFLLNTNEGKQKYMQDSLNQFDEHFEKKHIKYLKLVRKFEGSGNEELKICYPGQPINLNKQMGACILADEFQCSCCNCYVILKELECKRLMSANRIHQVKMLRQVRMRKRGLGCQEYDLVPVCELCYSEYKNLVLSSNGSQNNRINSTSNPSNHIGIDLEKKVGIFVDGPIWNHNISDQKQKILISIASEKSTKRSASLKSRKDDYLTKTETTTIRHEIQPTINNKQGDQRHGNRSSNLRNHSQKQIQHDVGNQGRNRNRKTSLQLQQPFLLPKYPKGPMTSKERRKKYTSFLVKGTTGVEVDGITKENIGSETNDELSNAIAQYNEENKVMRNIREVKRIRAFKVGRKW